MWYFRGPPKQAQQAILQNLVIIPAFNEQASIGHIVAEVVAECSAIVLVVCDASLDETATIAAANGAHVLRMASNLGAWTATQCGLRYALREGYTTVVTMDADGQHRPEDIQTLLAPVVAGEADVVIGSCTHRGSPLRHIAWRLIRNASGLRYDDLTSGFRAINQKGIKALCSRCATNFDYQDVGVLLLLEAAGCKLLEIPVQMLPRTAGKSRIFHSWLVVFRYMMETLVLGLTKRSFERKPHAPR